MAVWQRNGIDGSAAAVKSAECASERARSLLHLSRSCFRARAACSSVSSAAVTCVSTPVGGRAFGAVRGPVRLGVSSADVKPRAAATACGGTPRSGLQPPRTVSRRGVLAENTATTAKTSSQASCSNHNQLMQGLLASRREGLERAMKDRILTAYLKDFTDDFGLAEFDENELFEHFVNYSIISKHHPESFEPEDVAVGGSGDLGLDGLAIVVNDHLVASKTTVDHLKKTLRRLDVDFFFIQTKSSSHFDAAAIGAVFSGIRQFFGPSVPTGANDTIRELHSVKEHIFDHSIDMERSPSCRIYFATTGVWTNEQVLRTRADQGVADLEATQLFSSASFIPIDAVALKKLYRDLKQKIVREFLFEKHTIVPQINSVQEAYIGIVPCNEYLKLVCDEDGSLNRRLFFDNVRDFQGHNPVNSEIEETVKDATQSDRFALLNNGVTVVARDVNKVGARFRLNDYQIVNGCQTTHILYSNRGMLTPSVYVPLKLIVTTDSGGNQPSNPRHE